MPYTIQEKNAIWLSTIPGIGPIRYKLLVETFGDPRSVFSCTDISKLRAVVGRKTADAIAGKQTQESVDDIMGALENKEIRAITQESDAYPKRLLQTYDPPAVLFAQGNLSLLKSERSIGIVGSRKATTYGKKATHQLAEELAEQHITIISGLARGIDTAAHEACLKAGGNTIAVLGNGLDVVYPVENYKLYEEIRNHGLLLTEYFLGVNPLAGNFPIRNRIISGLSDGILVVEAGEHSGTSSTVGYAIDQGCEIFAVPGNINSPYSFTPNQLIKNGCQVATCGQDILEFFGWTSEKKTKEQDKLLPVTKFELQVIDILRDEDLNMEEIICRVAAPAMQVMSVLTTMEMKGLVTQLPGRVYTLGKV